MAATIDTTSALPKRYDASAAERRWIDAWERQGVHRFEPGLPRDATFAIDTPPPTVSGHLHIGHAFSYAHTDFVARFQRMRGNNVFYPMGWDDNGLPTERRVQNLYGVRCDPSLPYEGTLDLDPVGSRFSGPLRAVSRRGFIELCRRVTAEDERAFKHLWTRLGLSVDWRCEYATIDERCRRVAQHAFLRLLEAGHAYTAEAPMMWDVGFRTAVAQAEVEDRLTPGALHEIAFELLPAGGAPARARDPRGGAPPEELTVATTRPELLAACVAVVVHPDDPRAGVWAGRVAVTPLFRVPVPVLESERVEPGKGTGAVMVCTFGDATDVEWWREERLPLRQILAADGTLAGVDFAAAPASLEPERASAAYALLEGKTVLEARAAIVALLGEPGSGAAGAVAAGVAPAPPALRAGPTPIEHAVKYYEKGDEPLEFLTSRQWFVRLLDRVPQLLDAGARVGWHPPFAGARYRDWTEHLQFDWCVSRQRWFGVPIPLWYPLGEDGRPDRARPILPDPARLPVDPMVEAPGGWDPARRDRPGGFTADPDVFDTWVTSSLTPQITSGWPERPELHHALFPFDVRPQSHEIIRTWAFYTIAQSLLHEGSIPWKDVLVSGWVRDPDRKKMSKSLGNVITPEAWIDRYSADAVRYWAAQARLGVDTTFDEAVLKVGARLATKLFHAARFVHGWTVPPGAGVGGELDCAFVAELRTVIARVTAALEAYDHAGALAEAERFFWSGLTDNYIELVKERLRGGEGAGSAAATLRLALGVIVRLFAPFLPFVTEEIWSWEAAAATGWASVHRAPWPTVSELDGVADAEDAGAFEAAVAAIGAVRRHKTEARRSMGAPLARVELAGAPDTVRRIGSVRADVAGAARAVDLILSEDPARAAGEVAVVDARWAEAEDG